MTGSIAEKIDDVLTRLDHNDDLRPIIRRLAEATHELARELAPMKPAEPMKVGQEYDVIVRVRATCTDTDDDGSVELQLENRNHQAGRLIALDADEIVDFGRRA